MPFVLAKLNFLAEALIPSIESLVKLIAFANFLFHGLLRQ